VPTKKQYAALKALGVCPSCGVRTATPGMVSCAECRQAKRALEATYIAAGLCSYGCGQPAWRGRRTCYKHLKMPQKKEA
jgi:hypothetical protein